MSPNFFLRFKTDPNGTELEVKDETEDLHRELHFHVPGARFPFTYRTGPNASKGEDIGAASGDPESVASPEDQDSVHPRRQGRTYPSIGKKRTFSSLSQDNVDVRANSTPKRIDTRPSGLPNIAPSLEDQDTVGYDQAVEDACLAAWMRRTVLNAFPDWFRNAYNDNGN